nr:carboxymuconolactone decarboxylase family protein [Candidatus Sigynarchaeota archaeon]
MGIMRDRLTEIKRVLQGVGKVAPDFTDAFMKFKENTEKDGALPKKVKKLIVVSLSVAQRCEWCIALNVKDALEAGATPQEIMEACFVAALMGGAPSLMFSQNVMKAIEEFAPKT